MKYRELGSTGIQVSPLCLGTMQFGWTADEAASLEAMSAAYEAGINFLDTADMYSNWVDGNPGGVAEEIIGANSIAQLNDSLAAFELTLVAEEKEILNRLSA